MDFSIREKMETKIVKENRKERIINLLSSSRRKGSKYQDTKETNLKFFIQNTLVMQKYKLYNQPLSSIN